MNTHSIKRAFLKTEDAAVLILGSLILMMTLLSILASSGKIIKEKTTSARAQLEMHDADAPRGITWHQDFEKLKNVQAAKEPLGKWLKKLSDKPGGWKSNPFSSFVLSKEEAAQIREASKATYEQMLGELSALEKIAGEAESRAKQVQFGNQDLNEEVENATTEWLAFSKKVASAKKKYETKAYSKWIYLGLLLLFFVVLFGGAQHLRGYGFSDFARGFMIVFILAVLSFFIAGQSSIKNLGIGYAAWSILIGLVISNTIGTPGWIKNALTTELYIKTGLVLLGAEILFGKILAIGLPGIFVAWVVTPIVFLTTYWFGQRILKISSKTLNVTISADMSVCGVSAAVAVAAASKASKEELTLAIGLSMLFTSVMMIVMPIFINAMGLPEVLGGAWIGGTIDATGAVVAAGAFLGDDALNVAATIKMIQNILIGIIAFAVAVYFSKLEGAAKQIEMGWGEIWLRFPKFILGFIGASILFSLLYAALNSDMAYALIDQGVLGSFTKNIRGWLFCLAFVSIGLSTNFRELRSHFSGGKPLILYICGQTFNLALTLLMAYIMFYLVFPSITANI